ncbi:TetR family transcriptional regulator [Spirillospora sp. NPDC048819]|uniref:TetR/AcrR family transcriptional regulator n=1 Tax=Spirillospora sp. NPDC048819 TaxID=3155268 RepID=UPI0033C08816
MPTGDKTATTRPGARPAGTRRPRDRKAQIVSAAADLFHRHGYHTVTMEEIARAVGITAGALYRHFRNKQELLARTVNDGLSAFESAVEGTAPGDIDALLDVLATVTLDRRDLGVLWQRESRNLPDAGRDLLRDRFHSIAGRTATVVQAARPGLSAADADLLAWALFSVFASPSHHAVQLPRARFHALLRQLGSAVVHADLPAAQEGVDAPPAASTPGIPRASRRESVLDAAARLFGEHGYQAVSMEDIGAAAGISGAGIYKHVTAKSELLVAALTRAADALHMDISRIFATASTPEQALTLLLRSYIDLTVTSSHLTGALITEVVHLPDEQRHALRRLQHDYVGEWVQLLTGREPGLTETEARVITQAVLATVNDLTRIGHLRRRPRLDDDLAALGEAVLAARLPPDTP